MATPHVGRDDILFIFANMHIHNTTFVCSERELPALLGLLRGEVIPALLEGGHAAVPRLARVTSALPGADEAESVSLQFEFESVSSLAAWKKRHLPQALEKVTLKFGDKVLVFSTLLQQLPHE